MCKAIVFRLFLKLWNCGHQLGWLISQLTVKCLIAAFDAFAPSVVRLTINWAVTARRVKKVSFWLLNRSIEQRLQWHASFVGSISHSGSSQEKTIILTKSAWGNQFIGHCKCQKRSRWNKAWNESEDFFSDWIIAHRHALMSYSTDRHSECFLKEYFQSTYFREKTSWHLEAASSPL